MPIAGRFKYHQNSATLNSYGDGKNFNWANCFLPFGRLSRKSCTTHRLGAT